MTRPMSRGTCSKKRSARRCARHSWSIAQYVCTTGRTRGAVRTLMVGPASLTSPSSMSVSASVHRMRPRAYDGRKGPRQLARDSEEYVVLARNARAVQRRQAGRVAPEVVAGVGAPHDDNVVTGLVPAQVDGAVAVDDDGVHGAGVGHVAVRQEEVQVVGVLVVFLVVRVHDAELVREHCRALGGQTLNAARRHAPPFFWRPR